MFKLSILNATFFQSMNEYCAIFTFACKNKGSERVGAESSEGFISQNKHDALTPASF
jgi:hypothetical protein